MNFSNNQKSTCVFLLSVCHLTSIIGKMVASCWTETTPVVCSCNLLVYLYNHNANSCTYKPVRPQ